MDEYYLMVVNMTPEGLLEEFEKLIVARKRGRDKVYDLQPKFDILRQVAKEKGIDLRKMQYEKLKATEKEKTETTDTETAVATKPETDISQIEMIETPDSSSINGFGYDPEKLILYVKFKSSDRIYSYPNIDEKMYQDLKEAESKGSFIARNIKRKPKHEGTLRYFE